MVKTIQPSRIELEVRFGYFLNGKFNSRLPDTSLYYNIKNHLDNLYKRYSSTISRDKVSLLIDYYAAGIRRIEEKTKIGQRVYYQHKFNLHTFDNVDWGIRFSKSHETDLDFEKDLESGKHLERKANITQRACNRIVYKDNRRKSCFFGFKIELGEVTDSLGRHFELELEMLPGFELDIDRWWAAIKTLYGWILNAGYSDQIISIKERACVTYLINRYIKNMSDFFLPIILVNRPRTLTDIRYIQDTAVSLKIDGEHKILLFCKYGTYSCAAPFNIVKINDAVNEYDYIIESEYLPSQDIYYVFDIMISKSLSTIHLPFKERYNILRMFISEQNPKYGTFIMKKFYTRDDCENLIYDYYNSPVPLDGLIFQPLGNYINIINKWKPPEHLTIDFYLVSSNAENGSLWHPYVMDSNNLVPFNSIVFSNSIPAYFFDNKIVECSFVPEKNYWTPVRIRPDKSIPNTKLVAKSIVRMLKSPITLDQIISVMKARPD